MFIKLVKFIFLVTRLGNMNDFGLSECNRVKEIRSCGNKFFYTRADLIREGGKNDNCRVAFPESVPSHLKLFSPKIVAFMVF